MHAVAINNGVDQAVDMPPYFRHNNNIWAGESRALARAHLLIIINTLRYT
jgi:hypothetical protein